jgi:dihydroxyacetone kinase-like predicted kinase
MTAQASSSQGAENNQTGSAIIRSRKISIQKRLSSLGKNILLPDAKIRVSGKNLDQIVMETLASIDESLTCKKD